MLHCLNFSPASFHFVVWSFLLCFKSSSQYLFDTLILLRWQKLARWISFSIYRIAFCHCGFRSISNCMLILSVFSRFWFLSLGRLFWWLIVRLYFPYLNFLFIGFHLLLLAVIIFTFRWHLAWSSWVGSLLLTGWGWLSYLFWLHLLSILVSFVLTAWAHCSRIFTFITFACWIRWNFLFLLSGFRSTFFVSCVQLLLPFELWFINNRDWSILKYVGLLILRTMKVLFVFSFNYQIAICHSLI